MTQDLEGSVGERGESLSEKAAQPEAGGGGRVGVGGGFMLDAETWRVSCNCFSSGERQN